MAVHAQPRATKDLDILVKAEAENAKAVFAALATFGAPLHGMSFADFAEPSPFFRMEREPVSVDILTAIPGVEFDAAWERRVEVVIDRASGLKATFISAMILSPHVARQYVSGRQRFTAGANAACPQ